MGQPHKHAEIIKAWADGADIQFRTYFTYPWTEVPGYPIWEESTEYHIKPEPKPDVVVLARVRRAGASTSFAWCFGTDEKHNLCLTFDGETDQLKSAEVLK